MKKTSMLLAVAISFSAIAFFFTACEKEETKLNDNSKISESVSVTEQNESLEQIALMVNNAIKDASARNLIKEQALKKYDGQYDVPFTYLKELPVSSLKSSGSLKFKDLLIGNNSNLKSASSNTDSYSELETLIAKIPNLQISVPVHCDEWNADNYQPLVAILPMDFEDMVTEKVKAFDAEGNEVWIDAKVKPSVPVIVVGQCERLDENGNLMYDREGIMISPESRVSALDAINNPDTVSLKSSNEKIFEILDDLSFVQDKTQELKSEEILTEEPDAKAIESIFNLKSAMAVPSAPINVKAFNTGYIKSVSVYWEPVSGASYYKVYHRVDGSSTISYRGYSYTTDFTDKNLSPEVKYHYYVKAVNSSGESSYSAWNDKCWDYPSFRENKGYEGIKKLYMSTDYFNSLESWLQGGDLEIQIHLVHGYMDANGTRTETKTALYSDHSGKYHVFEKDDLRGKDCYIRKQVIQSWNYDDYNPIYTLLFVEDDGYKSETTHNISVGYDKSKSLGLNKDGASGSFGSKFAVAYSASIKITGRKTTHIHNAIIKWHTSTITFWKDAQQKNFCFRIDHIPYNWGNKCPYQNGRWKWDGAHCMLEGTKAPTGTTAWIWSDGLYYTMPSNGQCNYPGGWYEGGTSCKAGLVPQEQMGTQFVYNNGWYIDGGY